MSKILFISTRYPFPIYGGDKLRAFDILKFLSKKNHVDLVCIGKKEEINNKNLNFCKNIKVFHLNFISRIINTLFALLKLEPLQNGYFLSNEMRYHIHNIQDKYDSIVCHLLRSSQYLPDKFSGKKVLETTDLLSSNYEQSINELSSLNPYKYIYIIEKLLVEKYEKKIFKKFNNIVFVTNADAKKAKKKISKKNKIYVVSNAKNFNFSLFKYKKNNNKIIFIGNIKYLPNRLACNDFVNNVLNKIHLKYPKIEFHVIGDIGFVEKFFLQKNKKVFIHGKIDDLKKVLKNSICGLCNVKISTGFQNKVLTYMSYGIPSVLSHKSFINMGFKKNKDVLVFKNNQELLDKIFYLIKNKKKARELSINSKKIVIKKYNSNKVLSKYSKII